MSKTVKPENLQSVIMDYLNDYREDIQEDVEEATNTITKQAKEELTQSSREKFKLHGRDEPYYKGWTIKLQKKGKLKYHKVIWNKTNYQLTHLLEFGHVTRNGGRTKPVPHIRPIEEKYGVEFVDLLEKKIRRTSK